MDNICWIIRGIHKLRKKRDYLGNWRRSGSGLLDFSFSDGLIGGCALRIPIDNVVRSKNSEENK